MKKEEKNDQYGRRKKLTVTTKKARNAAGASLQVQISAYDPPINAQNLEGVLAEVEAEIERHPRKGVVGSFTGAAEHAIEQIRHAQDIDPAVTVFSLGIFVERMRNELKPSRGGSSRKLSSEEIARRVSEYAKKLKAIQDQHPNITRTAAIERLASNLGVSVRTVNEYLPKKS